MISQGLHGARKTRTHVSHDNVAFVYESTEFFHQIVTIDKPINACMRLVKNRQCILPSLDLFNPIRDIHSHVKLVYEITNVTNVLERTSHRALVNFILVNVHHDDFRSWCKL